MPKILVNIEDRIFVSAKELFYEKGYDQVNMKDISQRADIAVGTLYNYFSNKNELYFRVLENSWNDTFRKLDNLLEKDIDDKTKLKCSIKLIYEEVLDRRCMGVQVRKTKDLKNEQCIVALEKEIKLNLKKIFKDVKIKEQFKDDKNILAKIVYTLLISLPMLIDYYPEDKENNIDYLYNIILGFIK